MILTSEHFDEGHQLPKGFTTDGDNVNPTLLFEDIPTNAKSLALVMYNPNSLVGKFYHWLLFNIDITVRKIEMNSYTGLRATNDFNTLDYFGPFNTKGKETFVFELFALNKILKLPEGCTRKRLMDEIYKHKIDSATLSCFYETAPYKPQKWMYPV